MDILCGGGLVIFMWAPLKALICNLWFLTHKNHNLLRELTIS